MTADTDGYGGIAGKAEIYAERCHRTTNHLYDGEPYKTHLAMVVDVCMKFIHLIPEDLRDSVIAACWAHDVIEDCRQTYNDVKKELGEFVADVVYALTNSKGRTRAERANKEYYTGIRATPCAIFVKVCDRIANLQYSINNNSAMARMYFNEMDSFIHELYSFEYEELFQHLRGLE